MPCRFFQERSGWIWGWSRQESKFCWLLKLTNHAGETITLNLPHIALIGDIRDYSADRIRTLAGLNPGDDIHSMIGGPPCQAFSTAGKRQGFQDDRGNVFLTFIDRILELNPHVAIIENVRDCFRLRSDTGRTNQGAWVSTVHADEEKGGALNYILHWLRSAGYGVSFNLYREFRRPTSSRTGDFLFVAVTEKRLPTSPPPIQKMAASGCRLADGA